MKPDDSPANKRDPLQETGAGSFSKSDTRYWKTHLIRRKYCEEVRFIRGQEYSARISLGGRSWFFPLGSDNPDRAAVRAVRIFGDLASRGWEFVCARHPREITVAVYWAWSPLACSYTTLYSFAGSTRPKTPVPDFKRPCHVAVIEKESAVREALAHWIDRQPGFRCLIACEGVGELAASRPPGTPTVILANRDQMDTPGDDPGAILGAAFPSAHVFRHGVFEESNYIFHSVTGVSAGYLLRRRPPGGLFDPIHRLARDSSLPGSAVADEIKRYFQSFFEPGSAGEKEDDLAHLTRREHEILLCLSKGLADKEIADALKISVWTVHGHVKNIFEKLGVHSRTEAVIRYLQK